MASVGGANRLLQFALISVFTLSGISALTVSGRNALEAGSSGHIPTQQEVQALYALDAIYKGEVETVSETDAEELHARKDVHNTTGDAAEGIYGEIQPDAVLEMFRMTGVKEGQKYYDLGSGYGKTVVLAYLMGLNGTGIELAEKRWQSSCNALHRAPAVGVTGPGNGVNFVQASFFDVDFSDADLVFMDSVMFSDDTMKGLAAAARHLRPGSQIVSSHFGLPGPGFLKLGTLEGAVSWTSRKSRWTIQAVTAEAASFENGPGKPAAHPDGAHSRKCTTV